MTPPNAWRRRLGEDSMLAIIPPETKVIIMQCLLTGENKLNLQTVVKNRTIALSFIPIIDSKTVHSYANEITERLALEAQVRHSVKMEAQWGSSRPVSGPRFQ